MLEGIETNCLFAFDGGGSGGVLRVFAVLFGSGALGLLRVACVVGWLRVYVLNHGLAAFWPLGPSNLGGVARFECSGWGVEFGF